ncbi:MULTISPECIES: hypothetical protein [unclassified Streptomyces]|uniref:Gram-positive cocci surface proteins LPxTG domain-containing protein n=1 Tax=Streptomyces sp. R33 TaxID=3238629 RepID=A0AB39Y4H3_9ACTN|nr:MULTISPECIES: hypothetical protein [unclassified Streptomyces]KOY57875.1 hypothetical protein ADK59_10875 [Streptomyces sp. XY332]THA29536.1 hypothetical protein E6W17_39270 [Streptomyces sp. A1547]
MSARRPLLTALGATTLLAALWFVPSANATAPGSSAPGSTASDSGSAAPESANAPGSGAGRGSVTTLEADPAGASPQTAGQIPLGLADTGGIDTTPYLLGGTLCLGLGAGFVTFSVRRSRA